LEKFVIMQLMRLRCAFAAFTRPQDVGMVAVCFLTFRCYTSTMTKLLDDALAAVRNLPPDEQDSIARALLRLTGAGDEEPPVALSTEERAAIAASKFAAARGEFASDEQVRAVWAKHGL
jgi:hypothetical protein